MYVLDFLSKVCIKISRRLSWISAAIVNNIKRAKIFRIFADSANFTTFLDVLIVY